MSKTTIVLVRHGQSTFNAANKFCGWFDAPLTVFGEEQAQRTGFILNDAGFTFDAVYCSPLQRSQQTAKIIRNVLGLKPFARIDWRFIERPYGAVTGLDKTCVAQNDPNFSDWHRGMGKPPELWRHSKPKTIVGTHYNVNWPVPEGASERLFETSLRVGSVLQEIVREPVKKDRTILVSTHGNVMRGAVYNYENHTGESIRNVVFNTGEPLILFFENGMYQHRVSIQ